MPSSHVVVESNIDLSMRARQVCSMYDCPPEQKQRLEWNAELPIEDKDWSIGLIVGPSGCGKTTIAREFWPEEMAWEPKFDAPTVIDSFSDNVEEVSKALGAVGFNTIPAWLRPFHVLSNGEKFRVEIAKRMLEQQGVIVVDEFTSVVDRQVASIASHAVQKYVRREKRQLVAVSCHDDIVDWLQPDWLYTPANQKFAWRSLRRRPELQFTIRAVPYSTWKLFAPYHYLTADLNRSARTFGLFVNGEICSFAAVLHFPHPRRRNLKHVSRVVTLPDYQGCGFSFVLLDALAACYKAIGQDMRMTPAHPPFIRSFGRSKSWKMVVKPRFSPNPGGSTGVPRGLVKQRHTAVFKFIGDAWEDKSQAEALVGHRK